MSQAWSSLPATWYLKTSRRITICLRSIRIYLKDLWIWAATMISWASHIPVRLPIAMPWIQVHPTTSSPPCNLWICTEAIPSFHHMQRAARYSNNTICHMSRISHRRHQIQRPGRQKAFPLARHLGCKPRLVQNATLKRSLQIDLQHRMMYLRSWWSCSLSLTRGTDSQVATAIPVRPSHTMHATASSRPFKYCCNVHYKAVTHLQHQAKASLDAS